MKYKAVISDLDGTLLNSNHTINDYTKDIINKVIDKGVKFFIATGRHHVDVEHIRKSLNLDTIFITSNGSRVHNSQMEAMYSFDIEEGLVKEILNLDIHDDIHVNLYQEDYWFTNKDNTWSEDYHKDSNFTYKKVKLDKLSSYKASKVFFISENHDQLSKLEKIISEKYFDKLNVTFSLPLCMELMPKGVSKGDVLKKVLEHYNIHPEETIAFGDGLNDLEMLKVVGKGLIMGNGQKKLKEELSHLSVIETNDQNGVANYLKKEFL